MFTFPFERLEQLSPDALIALWTPLEKQDILSLRLVSQGLNFLTTHSPQAYFRNRLFQDFPSWRAIYVEMGQESELNWFLEYKKVNAQEKWEKKEFKKNPHRIEVIKHLRTGDIAWLEAETEQKQEKAEDKTDQATKDKKPAKQAETEQEQKMSTKNLTFNDMRFIIGRQNETTEAFPHWVFPQTSYDFLFKQMTTVIDEKLAKERDQLQTRKKLTEDEKMETEYLIQILTLQRQMFAVVLQQPMDVTKEMLDVRTEAYNIQNRRYPLLLLFVEHGRTDLIEQARKLDSNSLYEKYKPYVDDDDTYTAIEWACKNDQSKVVQQLLGYYQADIENEQWYKENENAQAIADKEAFANFITYLFQFLIKEKLTGTEVWLNLFGQYRDLLDFPMLAMTALESNAPLSVIKSLMPNQEVKKPDESEKTDETNASKKTDKTQFWTYEFRKDSQAWQQAFIQEALKRNRDDVAAAAIMQNYSWRREFWFEAAAQGAVQTVIQMLAIGKADINAKNKKGETALLLSIHQQVKPELAQYLIEQGGADVTIASADDTPLQKAIVSLKGQLANLLIEHGANIKNPYDFILALKFGQFATAIAIIEKEKARLANSVDSKGVHVIFLLLDFVQYGTPSDQKNLEPVLAKLMEHLPTDITAIPYGSGKVVDLLRLAIQSGNQDFVLKLLATRQLELEPQHIFLAVKWDMPQVVDKLLAKNPPLMSATDGINNNLLILAIHHHRSDNYKTIKVMLDHAHESAKGIQVLNEPNKDGKNALYYAVEANDRRLTYTLLKNGFTLVPNDLSVADELDPEVKRALELQSYIQKRDTEADLHLPARVYNALFGNDNHELFTKDVKLGAAKFLLEFYYSSNEKRDDLVAGNIDKIELYLKALQQGRLKDITKQFPEILADLKGKVAAFQPPASQVSNEDGGGPPNPG